MKIRAPDGYRPWHGSSWWRKITKNSQVARQVEVRVAHWVKDQADLQTSDSTSESGAKDGADDAGREQEPEAKLETPAEAAARFAAEWLSTLKGKAEQSNDVLLSAAKAQGADLVQKWMAQTNFWKKLIEQTDSRCCQEADTATKRLEDDMAALRKVKRECRVLGRKLHGPRKEADTEGRRR
ncbi:hypothetical protein AURDEDRAFT_132013 [Auricularia subglabra TFB-10046 SS5]|uniref:Uncharacterized protein n=1 Tax=Auricularia subglabra (strain TFB-10046 / SS5) TaxID=717982 RepID=J0D299_AURST|nr:hypothetical protein AURDEDRAFT_132013 [Auricularia subglabra TFB-10046 SS5]